MIENSIYSNQDINVSHWNGNKRKKKSIEILYEEEKPTLKVLKVIGKRLESTGIPVAGGFELFPEEAVYLLETGSATVSTPNGADLSILDAYSILQNCGVPYWKYEIYKHVKRMGLVVLRPRKNKGHWDNIKRAELLKRNEISNNSFELVMSQHSISAEGVLNPGSFPGFTYENDTLSLQMKALHTNFDLVSFLPSMNDFPTTKTLEHILTATPPSKKKNKCCRPINWPIVESQRFLNWSMFNLEVEKRNHAAIRKRFRQLNPSAVQKSKTASENTDFDVFSPCNFSHRLRARPIFSIICSSSSIPRLDIRGLSKSSNMVIAIEESSKVSFMSLSGRSINLQDFMENKS